MDRRFQNKLRNFMKNSINDSDSSSTVQQQPASTVKKRTSLGIVISVNATSHQHIEIIGDKFIFNITAYDDSCSCNDSHASMRFIKGRANDLVGQVLVSAVTYHHGDIQDFYPGDIYKDSSTANYDLHVFQLRNGKSVHILGSHHHNGYYGGGTSMTHTLLLSFQTNSKCRAIFVLGLPASGKTTYCHFNFPRESFHIKDDFLFDPVHKVDIGGLLEQEQNVVICDPRLCDLENFYELYDLVMRVVVSKEQICVVMFENNPKQCLMNIHRTDIRSNIRYFHRVYNRTIEFIQNMEGVTIHSVPVFKPRYTT